MTETQQVRLEAEFPSARVSSISKGGTKLTYVPVGEVINRLNEVLGTTNWSWETVKVWRDEHDPDWVLAVGKMTATVDGVESVKAGEGGVKVKRTTRDKEIVDLGDEFKGAASDALKKAAQKFGVGLYLSRTDQARRYEAPNPTRDAEEEGWRDGAEQIKLCEVLSAEIKLASDDVRQAMRVLREREGVIWPPTRDEYDMLRAEFAKMAAVAAGSDEKPTEPSAAPPVRESILNTLGEPHQPDRFAAASAFVNGLSKTDLVKALADYQVEVPRSTDAQKRLLVETMCADSTWSTDAMPQETLL